MTDELVTSVSGSFASAREAVVAALKEQGFGVLTSVDVRDTLRAKLNVDFEEYEILGVCNPALAHQALEIDRSVGLLLPCSVTLRQTVGGIEVRVLDPEAAFRLAPESALEQLVPVAREARARLVAAVRELSVPGKGSASQEEAVDRG